MHNTFLNRLFWSLLLPLVCLASLRPTSSAPATSTTLAVPALDLATMAEATISPTEATAATRAATIQPTAAMEVAMEAATEVSATAAAMDHSESNGPAQWEPEVWARACCRCCPMAVDHLGQ